MLNKSNKRIICISYSTIGNYFRKLNTMTDNNYTIDEPTRTLHI